MQLTALSIICAARAHGETAVIARMFSEEYGMVAAYVAGGRGRRLRPVVIPGNVVHADLHARSESQLPFARLELVESRGPWLSEALPAAAIGWITALTASVLPERNAYPNLYSALVGVLDAVCSAPSARGWLPGLIAYETLLLRELGYGGAQIVPPDDCGKASEGTQARAADGGPDLESSLARFKKMSPPLQRYLLADNRRDVMAARALLEAQLERMNS